MGGIPSQNTFPALPLPPPLGIEVRVGRGAWDLGSVARLWASRFSGEGGWDDQEGAASLREGCVASPRWGGSATRV